ncbi:hypothetical protein ccbrp13_20070 [Ktedonobacteria bacterium brp13]|nr:hypothetical protein ccbrp13_20070 [Ktedonobacteria bacterium brp13]
MLFLPVRILEEKVSVRERAMPTQMAQMRKEGHIFSLGKGATHWPKRAKKTTDQTGKAARQRAD